jgi:phosphate starvation-inducible PhoH-like protein
MSKGRRRYSESEARRIGLKVERKQQRQFSEEFHAPQPKPVQPIVRVKARTQNQYAFMEMIDTTDVCFGIGPAGSGKTHIAVGVADSYLVDGFVDRVIICRPAVGVGKTSGFLPGSLEAKLSPFLRPIFDEYAHFRGKDEVRRLMKEEILEIASLEHIQGRTLRNAVIILDEAQNATKEELWHFMTRLGEGSKMIITGALSQSVLHPSDQGALLYFSDLYRDAPHMGVSYMTKADIVRHPTLKTMITIREQYEPGFIES